LFGKITLGGEIKIKQIFDYNDPELEILTKYSEILTKNLLPQIEEWTKKWFDPLSF
jgi:hypothetical protein